MEPIRDEWYYAELLELLKEKEREKEETYYRPLELELPFIEPLSIGDEPKDEEKNRGVIIIEF